MKMKSFFIVTSLAVALLGLSVSGCKKKRAFNEENALLTVDARMVQGECDEVIKDVNTVIMEETLLRGKGVSSRPAGTSVCGVKLDTSRLDEGIVTLNYGGSCYGKTRSGTVRVTVVDYPQKKWKHEGCQLRIEYIGLKITRQSDGKSVLLDGSQFLTNESGGSWFDLWYMGLPEVVYANTGQNMKVVFKDNTVIKMNFARRMTFSFAKNVTTCRIFGLGEQEGNKNLENWGTGRDETFYMNQVVTPVVWKTTCGAVAPVSGEIHLISPEKEYALKCFFGMDEDGNDQSGIDNPCPFGWKVEWSRKRKTQTRLFSYY